MDRHLTVVVAAVVAYLPLISFRNVIKYSFSDVVIATVVYSS